jgi:hypothetical protein
VHSHSIIPRARVKHTKTLNDYSNYSEINFELKIKYVRSRFYEKTATQVLKEGCIAYVNTTQQAENEPKLMLEFIRGNEAGSTITIGIASLTFFDIALSAQVSLYAITVEARAQFILNARKAAETIVGDGFGPEFSTFNCLAISYVKTIYAAPRGHCFLTVAVVVEHSIYQRQDLHDGIYAGNINDSQHSRLDTELGEGNIIGTTSFVDVWGFVGGFGELLGVTAQGDL